MLIYYFSTAMMNLHGKEGSCNIAPMKAYDCIAVGVIEVRMSDRNTANKL
jgi:hypothetical protein